MNYFAYGSNMSREQMSKRCPGSKYIGYGYLNNFRIDFTKISNTWKGGVADIIESDGDKVWGLFYSVTTDDLISLDKYEGYPKHYNRMNFSCQIFNTEMAVEISNTQSIEEYYEKLNSNQSNFKDIEALAYTVVNKSQSTILPSLTYLNVLQDAAFEHNFPIRYQEKLNSFGAIQRESLNAKVLDLFLDLNDSITRDDFTLKCNNIEEFGGANLVITNSEKRKNELNKNYPSDLVILSPYYKELSWLVSEIYHSENTTWLFNYSNKYIYFQEFGEALLAYQENNPNDMNHVGICKAGLIKVYSLITQGGILYIE